MAQAEKLQRKYHPNCLGGTGASVLGVRDKYEEALACSMTLMHAKMTSDMTGQFVKKAIRGEPTHVALPFPHQVMTCGPARGSQGDTVGVGISMYRVSHN